MGSCWKLCAAAVVAGMLLAPFAAADDEEKDERFESQRDKVSYAIGLTLGESLKDQGVDVSIEMLNRGIKDSITGADKLMDEREMMMTLMEWQQQMADDYRRAQEEAAEKNLEEGRKFLEEYAQGDEVVKLDSGLMYRVIEEGDGPKPEADDTVSINYTGTLIDGTEFDSSRNWGDAAELQVGGVIPGVSEALKLMPVGSKWEIVIPSELGYGDEGAGDAIAPHAVLIFEIELLDIVEEQDVPMEGMDMDELRQMMD